MPGIRLIGPVCRALAFSRNRLKERPQIPDKHKAGSYARMAHDHDMRDQKYTGFKDRIRSLGVKVDEMEKLLIQTGRIRAPKKG